MPTDRDIGRPLQPMDVYRAMRWLGDLTPDVVVEAMKAGAERIDLADQWPDLTAEDIAATRAAGRGATSSRLRAWRAGERTPTWPDIRALISGLPRVIE